MSMSMSILDKYGVYGGQTTDSAYLVYMTVMLRFDDNRLGPSQAIMVTALGSRDWGEHDRG
ncbi:hypothetical protein GB937_002726 [Aspergillus fischeri]|nr:hypothetical protein GB937_002726 [Aspergillus fischeri]